MIIGVECKIGSPDLFAGHSCRKNFTNVKFLIRAFSKLIDNFVTCFCTGDFFVKIRLIDISI